MFKYALGSDNKTYNYSLINLNELDDDFEEQYSLIKSTSSSQYKVSFTEFDSNVEITALDTYTLKRSDVAKSLKRSFRLGLLTLFITFSIFTLFYILLGMAAFAGAPIPNLFIPIFIFFSITFYFPIKFSLHIYYYLYKTPSDSDNGNGDWSSYNNEKISLVKIYCKDTLISSTWYLSKPLYSRSPLIFAFASFLSLIFCSILYL